MNQQIQCKFDPNEYKAKTKQSISYSNELDLSNAGTSNQAKDTKVDPIPFHYRK